VEQKQGGVRIAGRVGAAHLFHHPTPPTWRAMPALVRPAWAKTRNLKRGGRRA